MSILSSTRNAKNSLLSEKIFHRIELNFSDNERYLISAPVFLANTYALNGNKWMALNIRMKLTQSNMEKIVGCTWTVVVNGKVHVSWNNLKIILLKNSIEISSSWSITSICFGNLWRIRSIIKTINRPGQWLPPS